MVDLEPRNDLAARSSHPRTVPGAITKGVAAAILLLVAALGITSGPAIWRMLAYGPEIVLYERSQPTWSWSYEGEDLLVRKVIVARNRLTQKNTFWVFDAQNRRIPVSERPPIPGSRRSLFEEGGRSRSRGVDLIDDVQH